jgi:RTX calcium-binding nonapeptide repeat (4 copies)
VIKNILHLIELKVVSHLFGKRKITCYSSMNLKLSLTVGIEITTLALIAVLIIGSLSKEQSAFALTRGTQYDDLLSSSMTTDSNRDELSSMGTNSTQVGTFSNNSSAFIYGDLGNDEIRGSSQSDHLSGGPGSDEVYGNNGGDYIQGGPGMDSLYGGDGDDVLTGSEGADYFDCGEGRDNIDDFEPIQGDYSAANCEILENEEKPVAMR